MSDHINDKTPTKPIIAEIIGPTGRVHYRRPPGDPLCAKAEQTEGYSVRYVHDETVEPIYSRD